MLIKESLMRKFWFFLAFAMSLQAMAQTSTVTVNVTDSAGQTWNNGTVSYVFVPNPIYGGQTPQFSGSALASSYLVPTVVILSSSGTGSISALPRTDYITPIGGQWKFVICPQFTAPCGTLITPITAATVNLSTLITGAITPPIVTGFGSNSVAYSSSEVLAYKGALYYDLTAACEKLYTGTWGCLAANSGGSFTGVASITMAAGGTVSSSDTGTPTIQYSANSINLNPSTTATGNVNIGNTTYGGGLQFFQPTPYSGCAPGISANYNNLYTSGCGGFFYFDNLATTANVQFATRGTGSSGAYSMQSTTPTMGVPIGTSVVASATTITVPAEIFHINGTTAIATINPVLPFGVGGTKVYIIADSAWTTVNTGNISTVITAVSGTMYTFVYDGTKWYIK
jgi:hypothetical protein